MKITDIPQDIEPRVGDIIEIEQGEDCFEVRIIGITADGYLCEQDNVQGAVLLEGTALDHSDVADIMPLVEGLRDPKDNPCWKGYHPVGTKQKNGRTVPNCVPNAKESVEEAGPFSYGAKKPRRGSVAYNAMMKRREQEKNRPPIEPKDQMVGTAKLTKDVSETSDYFRRREREEAIISGQKPARKKQPAQTSDYARRREQEKKAEIDEASKKPNATTRHLRDYPVSDKDVAKPITYYSLVHKATNKVLSTHKDLESAKDEHRGMDQGERAHYRIATTTKAPKSFDMTEEAEGMAEGYTGRETKDGTWRVFKDGQAVAVAGPFKSRDEAHAWIKNHKQGVAEGSNPIHPELHKKLTAGGYTHVKDNIYTHPRHGKVKISPTGPDKFGRSKNGLKPEGVRIHGRGIEAFTNDWTNKSSKFGEGVAESGLQYHTGVKKHGEEYMRKAAEAGRKGASQEELGRLRDRYSKAYKKDVKEEQLDEYSFADKKTYMKFLAAKVQKYGVQALKPEERAELIAYLQAQKMTQESGQEEHEYSLSLGSGRRPGYGWDQDSTSRADRMQAQDDELKQRSIERLLKKHPEWERSDLELASLPELIRMLRGDMTEAEYQGRKVALGKPMAGDVKKSKVYVRKPNGKVVKVNFGDKTMKIKKSNPNRRKSFRARHNCENPGPRWKARYWSCRAW